MSTLRGSAASGVVWMAFQIWFVRLTTVGAFIVLSRHLSPTEFGLVALAMAVIGIMGMLSDSGLATYVIRTQEITPRVLSTAFWTSMAIAALLAALLAALAVPASALFGEPGLGPVLQVLSIGIVLTGLNSVPTALLKREMRFKSLAVRGTIATVVGSVVAIAMAVSGYGVWALVAQSLVRGAVSVVILWTATRWFPSGGWDRREAREMLGFGSKLLSIDLLNQARDRGQEFALAAIGGAAALGTWAVANRILRIVQETGSSVISSVATPTFARLQDDRSRLFRAYEKAVSTSGVVLFPAMLLLAVTSADLVPLLLGQHWATTGRLAQIMALTAVVTTFSYFDRPVFVALGLLKTELALVVTSTVSQLAIVVLVAPHGLMPLAVALLVRVLVLVPTRFVTLHRTTGMPYRAMVAPLRVLLAAVLAAAVAWLGGAGLDDASRWVRVVAALGLGIAAYPAVLWWCARPVARSAVAELVALRRGGRRARDVRAAGVTADLTDGDGPSAEPVLVAAGHETVEGRR